MVRVSVGALTTGLLATVDEDSTIRLDDARSLRWRVRTGDRWVEPAGEVSLRATRLGPAPIAEHAVRIRGGDAIARTYGVGDHGGLVVVEVENASPEAVAVAFVVDGAQPEALLALSRPAGAIEPDGALAFPVPHRTVLRIAVGNPEVDVRALPAWDAVRRGWARQLERGMRTELPDPLQTEIDEARADLLLAPPSPDAFVMLEEWGFDQEAETMWRHLRFRERRAARRHRADRGVLGDARDALVAEADASLELLPGFRREWFGVNLAVHDVPLRRGRLSYAVRWHGERPALLWDAPAGIVLRTPRLDPSWSTADAVGETLLAAPPGDLPFAAAPESFS